jgi:flagellar hook protein FlgE
MAVPGTVPTGVIGSRTNGLSEATANLLTLTYDPLNGGEMMNFTLDLNNQSLGGSTQFGSSFAIQSSDQDGYSTGRLENLEVDTSGIVVGRFSNGQTRTLAQVQLAKFVNSGGLQPSGNSAWVESFSSGAPIVGIPGVSSLGSLSSGALEQSNVDLTAQLVSLITSQRNFQANAQSIRTGDTIAQTIINLR